MRHLQETDVSWARLQILNWCYHVIKAAVGSGDEPKENVFAQ